MSARFEPRIGLALLMWLSLLAVASCGGGGGASTAPSSTVPSHSKRMPEPQRSKETEAATSRGEKASEHHAEKASGHHRHHPRGHDEVTISRADHAKHGAGNGPDSTVKAANCPPSLSAQQCIELGEEAAHEQHSPRQTSKPSCPPALDRSTCEEAAQGAGAQAESPPPSQAEAPLHCPEALSRSQCEELEVQLGRS